MVKDFRSALNISATSSLKVFLIGEKKNVSYKQASLGLDMTEGAVKVAAHRMRQRYREILKNEVAKTLARPDEAEDEIRYLIAAVRR